MLKRLSVLLSALAVAVLLAAAPAQAQTLGQVIDATWPENEEAMATAIAYRESGGVADAYNPSSGAFCLFQLLPSTAAGIGADYSALADPYYCSAQAARLQDLYGWSPWAATYGAYYYSPYMSATPITYY
jgi:hypothetical protein